MFLAGTVFFLACVGIVALFTLKWWEREHARVLFPQVRRSLDLQALRVKLLVIAGSRDIEKLWPYMLFLVRATVHAGAVAFGHLAHWIGERSHALADLVSHKHRFERGAPRSEFLKQVIEHPMRNLNGSNRTDAINNFRSSDSGVMPSAAPVIKGPIVEKMTTGHVETAPLKKKRKQRVSKTVNKNIDIATDTAGLDR